MREQRTDGTYTVTLGNVTDGRLGMEVRSGRYVGIPPANKRAIDEIREDEISQ